MEWLEWAVELSVFGGVVWGASKLHTMVEANSIRIERLESIEAERTHEELSAKGKKRK